ncbi:hypothetical protein [Microbacterium mangrovi]|uniref:hypothetical protein n=1 Tax=Microbacterium mangrovi TaxID=1348253 RepID=UPI00068F313B|nr:hypothetical protein [Microbacterium mangrovi]
MRDAETPAAADARSAALRAGVAVVELDDMRAFSDARRLYEAVWRAGPTGSPVTADMLRAISASGNPVLGAYDGQVLVGACFGFCSPPETGNLHSHIAGVHARMQGRSIGFALKLHQRAWAIDRGIRTMTWTFDPLIRRNAVFNLVKLGTEVAAYLPDFYGDMDDEVNRSDASDRLLVRWQLHRPLPGPDPMPRAAEPMIPVAVPADIEALRLADPVAAAGWRSRIRRELGDRLAAGARVRGFDRDGHYLIAPAHPADSKESA